LADFRLPDLGEGVTEAEIERWLVAEGDEIADDDPLVEVITDKATVEIPSPFAGSVTRIHVDAGEVVPVGTVLVDYGETTATVAVWYSSLFGLAGEDSTTPVTESWYTNTYNLSWVDGDWKVADFEQEDGPVPVARDQRASTAEVMAEAIKEYGGFTYAR
jgi:pyruvate/2-oxoglutarate dehydrogenase complex dihydrolipoamide acyltransferase (E2) component